MLDSLTLSGSQRRTLQLAAETFAKNVRLAEEFLAPRGVSEEMAIGYQLGVVSEELHGFERFVGMLSIPYLSPVGPLAIKFRCISCEGKCEGHPKYNAPEGQQVRLYNVAALHTDADVVAICEGELDALVMTELVGVPAVGVPGASNWQDWYPRCFSDYETVLVVADNDKKEDGSNPGLKHARKVVAKVPGGRLVTPPLGLDLNDWVLRDGAAAVREACGV